MVDVICPYCNRKADYIDSKDYYSNGKSYGMMYICRPCDATVGVHKGTSKPKGTLANEVLREMRKQCHALIDPLWKSGKLSRSAVYCRVAAALGIDVKRAHIGHFREKQCQELLEKGHLIAWGGSNG